MAFGAVKESSGVAGSGGEVSTDGKGASVEKMRGAIMQAKDALDAVLQSLGPDTSQDRIFDKDNPAETKGRMEMRDQDRNLRKRAVIAKLQKGL